MGSIVLGLNDGVLTHSSNRQRFETWIQTIHFGLK